MRYLIDRLREPGTLRSLAVIALAFRNGIPDSMTPDDLVNLMLLLLGTVSAALPEAKVSAAAVAAAVAAPVAQKVTDRLLAEAGAIGAKLDGPA